MNHSHPYSIKRHGTTLEKCEHEPVQTPGCIQAHGVLLVLRLSDLTILQASENSQEWLGLSPQDLLAKNIAEAVGEPAAQSIRNALDRERVEKIPLYLTTLKAGEQKNTRSLHVNLHTYSGLALLELEDASACDTEPPDQLHVDPDYYGLVRKTLTRFQEASSIKALSQTITEELRRITELDRVMVYYFHADDSGDVIAESKREDQASWLGWRYPAHDIPRPAREIFKKIWSRPVPDVRAELFEMVPLLNPDTQEPLDMTYCSLRGVSVMYTEYLDNMGVRAALTLPLIREGELWGLIACHHNTPKLTSYRIRAASEFLARAASQLLMQAEERENTEYRISLDAANYALIAKVALAPELSAFTEGPVHLGAGLDCGGAAIFCQESWNLVGHTPQIQEMAELGEWLLNQPACQEGSPNPIFVTDHLSDLYPAAKNFAGCASGVMAFCFSRNPLGLIFYFKPETLQTLTWAGNPHELPVVEGPHGSRLSPRKSFELWRETVSNRSMPWKKLEIEAVLKLRGLVIDMLVSRAEQLNALRLRVVEQTQELAVSNARLQAVLDAATQISVIAANPEGLITVFNSGAEQMLGYTSEEMVGKQTPAIFHLESEIVARGQELTEEMGKPVQGFHVFVEKARNGQPEEREWTYVRKDGSHLTVALVITASFDASGKVDGFLGMAKDLSTTKQTERDLKSLALRLGLATQAMQAGVWDWDVRTNVIDWDKKMYEIYGQPVNGPVTYQKWADAVVPEDFPHAEATLQRVIASKSSASAEFRITVPNGALRHIHAAEGVVLDDAGEVVRVIGVNIDTTERKKLEHQFLRSQRIESMGTLAGGIAHELNNILAPIMMSIHILKDTAHDIETDDILETIDHSAKRGADIVRQVLSLARGVEGERIEVQPKSLLKDLENIIKNTFPKDVRLQLSIPDNTWAIWGDPTQVHQILLNLCLNARDAMPHGGSLAVRIENCALDEQYAAMNLQAKAGRYVNISVTDTGTGIPPELIDKIFEPFFTTKELNKGTGLGLSTVIAIVKSHGGIINVYSEPGNGTTFKVYLPAVEIASDARKAQSGKVSLPRGNGEMVLVVDDEPSILTITSRTLQASGYQVLTATDGANAVAVYLQHKKDIAVVLTDMAMPVMDGPAMIHALMRINPTVKIIAASGLNANGSVTKVSEPRVRHFLAKPYTAGALLKTLHVILDEA